MSTTFTFSTFYRDPSITGHRLLKPSIQVGHGFKYIFSPIKQGQNKLDESIKRMALLIILSLGAPISAVLIPLGLTLKGIDILIRGVPVHPALPASPRTPSKEPLSTVQTSSPSTPQPQPSTSHAPPPPTPQPSTSQPPSTTQVKLTRQQTELLDKVKPTLLEARSRLDEIDRREINNKELQEIQKLLKESEDIQTLLFEAPDKNPHNPITQAVWEYEMLVAWIDELDRSYNFYSTATREKKGGWLAEGEQGPVKDNGDCLFEASCWFSPVADSDHVDPESERKLTVEWMQKNYREDQQLQKHLIASMYEHYSAEIERLRDELSGLQACGRPEEAKKRLGEIPKEIQAKEKTYIEPIFSAMTSVSPFTSLESILTEYFVQMKKKGTHGGLAELYTLSCRHKVCFAVYTKRASEKKIFSSPFIIMNSQFNKKPIRRFTHSGNHYNPYTPPSSS